MTVSIKDTQIEGAVNIARSGSNWAITQDSNGYVKLPYQPKFDAYGSGSSGASQNSIWYFPTVPVNVGGHYNASNGRFTAPVNGTYFFYWTNIGGNRDDVFRYFFYYNGSQVRDVHLRLDTSDSGSEYGTNGMRTYMLNLSAGDYVNIYYRSDSGGDSYPGLNNTTNHYPIFGGYLLA